MIFYIHLNYEIHPYIFSALSITLYVLEFGKQSYQKIIPTKPEKVALV